MGVMHETKIILNIVAGIAGIIAALLWLASTKVTVNEPDEVGSWDRGAIISRDGIDLIETAAAQTLWSRRAAIAASIAAFAQSGAIFLP